jgi:hypothetical protein
VDNANTNRRGLAAAPLVLPTWRLVLPLFAAGHLFRYAIYAATFRDLSVGAYVDAICVWDCPSYLDVARDGYDLAPTHSEFAGRANWAFFPLYPILLWTFTTVTGATFQVAGYVISNTLTLIAAFAARPLFERAPGAYWLYLVMLFLGPFAVLVATVHTESAFVLFTILGLVALQRGQYVWAGGWSALLSATRPTGVLFTFAIITQVIVDHLRSGQHLLALPRSVLGNPRLLLGLLLAPLGLFLYMAYLRWHVGDGLSFARVQIAWGRELGNPLLYLFRGLFPPAPLSLVNAIGLAWAVGGLIGLLLCVVLLVQRQYAAAVFCTRALLVARSAGLTSVLRFSAGLAPLGIALAIMLCRWKPLAVLCAALLVAATIPVTMGWVRMSWFLM